MTRRRKTWIFAGAALVVAIAVGLAVLPGIVRRVAISKIGAAMGRNVAIEAVEFNLFTRRIAVKGFRLADRERPEPFVQFDKLEARFRLSPLLGGNLRLTDVTLVAPTVRIVRTGPAQFNFSDLLAAPGGTKEAEPPKAKGGVAATVDRFTLSGGTVIVEDTAIAPPRTWKAEGLTVEVTHLSTRAGAPAGAASVAFTLAGTPISLKASELRVVPADARATLAFQGFDLVLVLPYLPPGAPATLQSGRLDVALTLGRAGDISRADGEVRLENLVVVRRGQTTPSVVVPALTVAIKDVAMSGGAVTAGRIEVAGDPTVFDTNLSPPPRFDLKGLRVVVEDATWPPARPARVQVAAGLPRDGALEVGGTAGLAPLSADLQVGLKNVDLTLAQPYVPPDAPATLQSGRLDAVLKVRHAADVSRADGEVRLANLVAARRGQTAPSLSVPALRVNFKDVALAGGAVTAGRIAVDGDPTVYDTNLSPPAQYDLKALKIVVERATWPPKGPVQLAVTTQLPRGGSLDARGTATLRPVGADLKVAAKDLDVGLVQPYLPIAAPVAGKAEANLAVAATLAQELTATVKGSAGVAHFSLGPQDAPVLGMESVEASGVDVAWPTRVAVDRVVIRKPSATIERDQQNRFPILLLLAGGSKRAAVSPAAAAPPRGAPADSQAPAPPTPLAPPAAGPPRPALAIEVGEIVIEEGYGRFVDRTLSPPFSEEFSRLAMNLKGLSNAEGKRGRIVVQGVIGGTGAIQLQGDVAPLGEKLFLDLEGELRDFPVPPNNSYLNRLLAWTARDGRLSTKFRLRLDGDKLEANTEIVVARLEVAPAGDSDEVKRRIGLPLGLIVALMKDGRGEIRVSVPISGSLGAPEFSLGEAIWAAVRNVLVNVLAAPFRLIGRLFTRDNKIEGLDIDPVTFGPGSATVAGPMEERLKQVGEFLRNSPAIRLALASVVSVADLTALRTQEVTARLQRLQRERRLPDFAAAAARAYAERFPGKPAPKTPEEIVAALREVEPAPEEAGRALAARRLEAAQEALTKAGGIDSQRLQAKEGPAASGDPGEGRVEFTIVP